MDKIGELLYEQVYLFFLGDDSNDIVMNYINSGFNLLFNSDSLLITKGDESYNITVVTKRQKKYWSIYSNSNNCYYYLLCEDGNLNDVFDYINQL